jgi:hypothetical protein
MRHPAVGTWSVLLTVGLLLPLVPVAHAEDEVGPHLVCVPRALRIMAAEVSGLRLQCAVTGAPSGDQNFLIELAQQPADVAEAGAPALGQRTVCSGSLTGGAGACIGAVFNAASPALGETQLSALFLPSGTRLEDTSAPAAPRASAGDGLPVNFEPLPEEP